MSGDTYTEVTNRSWFNRMGSAFKGIVVGLVLFVGAIVLLFWNEGRSVKTYKALKEGAGMVISVPADEVNPANEGKLVHITGMADTPEMIQDPVFGGAVKAVSLRRSVRMFQWQEESRSEERKKLGGGTETVTTYTYKKDWVGRLINSSNFKQPEGHQNPRAMIYTTETFAAAKVSVGAFTLSQSLAGAINHFEPYTVHTPVEKLPGDLKLKAWAYEGGYYVGASPQDPQVGDCVVSFDVVRPQVISLVSTQRGNSFAPFHSSVGEDIQRLQVGEFTAAAMFEAAQSENTMLAWLLRLAGFVVMFMGLRMIFTPLSVGLDVIPFLGNVAGMGISLVSFLVALVLSLLTFAVAWIVYRPLLGIALVVVAVAGVFALIRLKRKKGMPPPPPAGPPPLRQPA